MTIDLRHGDWRDLMHRDFRCDSIIVDPPYSAKTHDGVQADRDDNAKDRALGYRHWDRLDVQSAVSRWALNVRKWLAIMTSHDLAPFAIERMRFDDLTTFAPVPIIFPDSVRIQGDGPASAAVYLIVGRTKAAHKWRSLPGFYLCASRERGAPIIGAKPLHLMRRIVSDYSDPGDLVVDPCAGWGTTLLAAAQTGRKTMGCEIDATTHAAAMERLRARAELFV